MESLEWETETSDLKFKVSYLHRYWSNEVHILQFCSTGEYFETPEYERLAPLGDRDIMWLPQISQIFIPLK